MPIEFSAIVRNIVLKDRLKDELENYVTEDSRMAPGQLRKRNGWYWLTYLKVIKVKNFDARAFMATEEEIDTIRAFSFRIVKNRLQIAGTKSEIKEIKGLLDSLALQLSGNLEDEKLNYEEFYKIDIPEIDLNKVLTHYEKRGLVADVRKLKMKDMEVKLGSVRSCVINTFDYGGVRKLINAPDNNAQGLEIAFRLPEKTTLYVDLDGQIKIKSSEIEDENELATMANQCAFLL